MSDPIPEAAVEAANSNKPQYTPEALAAMAIDFLEAKAHGWMEETGTQRMFNAIASVFEKWAPQELMDRFREQLGAIGHQCFVEGAIRAWSEISAERAALEAAREHGGGWRAIDDEREACAKIADTNAHELQAKMARRRKTASEFDIGLYESAISEALVIAEAIRARALPPAPQGGGR